MSPRAPELTTGCTPRHVGIVTHGDEGWAGARGLPRIAARRAGAEKIWPILDEGVKSGVRYLTLFVCPTEEWDRWRDEVHGPVEWFADFLDRGAPRLMEERVQVRHLGRQSGLPEPLRGTLRSAIERTRENDRLTVAFAFNYGGRADIVDSVRAVIAGGIAAGDVDDRQIAQHLSTAGMPDPDLVICTGGDLRLSNFLIWEAAYAEYWATPVLWPDFGPEHLGEAIREYGRRQRRFGGIPG